MRARTTTSPVEQDQHEDPVHRGQHAGLGADLSRYERWMAPQDADPEQLAALQNELTERLRVVNQMISAHIVRAAAERTRTGRQVAVFGASR